MPRDCSAVVITVIYWCVLALGLSITCSNQPNLTQCSAKVLQPQPLVLCKEKSSAAASKEFLLAQSLPNLLQFEEILCFCWVFLLGFEVLVVK